MFGKLVTILLIIFSTNCFGDVKNVERDWLGLDKKDSWAFYLGTSLLVVDVLQSVKIPEYGLEEGNIIQGRTPTKRVLYSYNASIVAIGYMMNRFADPWLKNTWNISLFSVQIYAISGNYSNGIRISRKF